MVIEQDNKTEKAWELLMWSIAMAASPINSIPALNNK